MKNRPRPANSAHCLRLAPAHRALNVNGGVRYNTPMALLEKVSIFLFRRQLWRCLALELAHLFSPRPVCALSGWDSARRACWPAQFYLLVQPLSLASPAGSLLFLALILVIFYVYGTLHHQRLAWGLFVLPLILG